jgi:hypothetical protein
MNAVIYQQGNKGLTKTYTTAVSVPDTNKVNWDNSNNGMNDYITEVITDVNTFVWLFAEESYNVNGKNIIVPNGAQWKAADYNVNYKIASFKVCSSNPMPIAPNTNPVSSYVQFQDFPVALNQRYLLLTGTDNSLCYPLMNNSGNLSFDKTYANFISAIGLDIDDAELPSNLGLAYQWQFFEVSAGKYVIANCLTGELMSPTSTITNAGVSMKLDNDIDSVSVYSITQYMTELGWNNFVALQDVTDSGNCYLSANAAVENNSIVYGCVGDIHASATWCLYPYGDPIDMPDLSSSAMNSSLPTYVNGTAPTKYPQIPEISNSVYVPYFMVNDKTMRNWGNRITYSPYYRLNQYWQFKLAASVINDTDGQVLFNESWTYGWTTAISGSVSGELGFALADKFTASVVLIKDSIQGALNAKLGITLSATLTGSGTYSKNLSIYVQPNKCAAVYGIETTYELYQMNGYNRVAKPNVPMRMDHNFLTIEGDLPTNSGSASAS